MIEKALNLAGMTGQDVGRSFALVAGVSHYPRLAPGSRELRPAEADRDQLVAYLQKEEFFDEIVVLWDEDMNLQDLSYFLREYFPRRLAAFPKSRFLFAYSGHGFADGEDGYLLGSSATRFDDKVSAVALRNVRVLIDEVVRSGYQVLVLLNSCYAGALLANKPFGGRYLPKHPGAHAITAGAAQEKAWSDSRIGPGSIFFEKVLAGLGGAADRLPEGGDGIITATELFAYLRQEVQVSTDQRQSPQLGDLSTGQSEGEFFFLNRAFQVRAKLVPFWNPAMAVPFSSRPHDQQAGKPGGEVEDSARGPITLAGTLPLAGKSFDMDVSGSFGREKILGAGGTLHVEVSLSPTSARYEQIELRTAFADREFSGTFAPGFGKKPIPIKLDVSFAVTVSLSHPSREFPLLPSSDGGFQLGPFYTADCAFSCYQLDVSGTWTATGPEHVVKGEIRGSLVGRGVGADAIARLDPVGYPDSVRLKGLGWHGNSGGTAIDLLTATVDGVALQLSATYVTLPGVEDSDLTLTEPSAAK